jgi:predicted DNA-binding protein with PD1-like motif
VHTITAATTQTLAVRLDPQEDVLLSLREAVRTHDIKNAVIVSGVGSLDKYRVHVVETTNMPPGNIFFDDEGPFDILTVTGMVVDGGVHAHITFSNPERAMGGHLEEGCRVLTFAVVVLLEIPDVSITGWDVRGRL